MTAKLKIQLAQINTIVGDLDGNLAKILCEFNKAKEIGCDLIIFPELSICGYSCEDLWQKKYFIEEVEDKISLICQATQESQCAILLGAPTASVNRSKKEIIHNSAILIEEGRVTDFVNKKNIPDHGVFDEARYFEAANNLSFIEFRGLTLAILICEDLWVQKNLFLMQEQILDAIIVINSSPYSANKHEKRQKIAENCANKLNKPLIYLNQVGGQDYLVFDGSSFVFDGSGSKICQLKEFQEDSAIIEVQKDGVISALNNQDYSLSEVTSRHYSACVLGLRDYMHKNGFNKVLLGMSGGIDSALVATMAVDALGSENVAIYALPSRFNSETSMVDAKNCAANLGLNLEVISIEKSFEAMLETLGDISDLAQENLQSRIRGNILMALSNNSGALLLSTGNKSEMSCGYATLYGDMCGAFNPIKDLYKTQIYELANWRNQNIAEIGKSISSPIPQSIISKEPTAELRHDQKDSDSLPEYDILDKILFALIEEQKSIVEIIKLGFEDELVRKIAKLFYNSEYKRQQSCIGVKVSEKSFDRERRYPITNKFTK